jgi:hypothetical protein
MVDTLALGENCPTAIRKAAAWIANATKRGGVAEIFKENYL